MATATMAPTLRQEVTALEGEISNLKTKLAAEQKGLDALDTERGQIAEAIALGQEKPSKAGEIARRIEQAEARASGFRSLLARKQTDLDKAWPELRRLEAEHLRATRLAKLEVLRQRGAEIVAHLNTTLKALITSDLPALDSIRDEMMEYKDLGGQAAGAALCESLLTSNGTLIEEDKLTNLRRDLHSTEPALKLRGDICLTVRNLWPARNR